VTLHVAIYICNYLHIQLLFISLLNSTGIKQGLYIHPSSGRNRLLYVTLHTNGSSSNL